MLNYARRNEDANESGGKVPLILNLRTRRR
jgi:hypothetical protein